MTDRFIVDDDYYWVDTLTGERVDVDDSFDIVNKLDKENIKLKNRINELEDDNERYCRVVERLGKTGNCFGTNSCLNGIVDWEANRIFWLKKYEDIGIIELLNSLDKEIKDYKDILQLLHEDMNYVKDLIFEYGSEELVSKYINRWRI